MRLSEILKQYRSEHGLSQRRFAELCGDVTNGYVSMVENELNPSTGKKVIPSLEKLKSFSRGMGISLKELLERADDIVIQDADDASPGERLLNYMTIFGDSIDDISALLGMSNEEINRVIAYDLDISNAQAEILGRRYGVKPEIFCDYCNNGDNPAKTLDAQKRDKYIRMLLQLNDENAKKLLDYARLLLMSQGVDPDSLE